MSPRDYQTVRLQRQGGSLLVVIPAPIVRAMKLTRYQEVKVYLVGRVVCVQPVDRAGFVPGVVAVRPILRDEMQEGQ